MGKSQIQNSTFMLASSASDAIRLVQITDSHIFSQPEGCLLGLNTRESLSAVCKRVKLEEWRPDILLATGDLSQDSSPESYQHLAEQIGELEVDTFWVAGNHDDPTSVEQHFTHSKIFHQNHILAGDWQIILLDSSLKDEVHGHLNERQLQFMTELLAEYSDKHTLIVLHHHPIDIGCAWLDNIGLRENQPFLDIVKKNKNVKGVLWGHIHQEFDQMIGDVRWLASPSSCVQFAPGSSEFSADTKAPGYRYIELLDNGCIETRVNRVDNIDFTVDYSVKGY